MNYVNAHKYEGFIQVLEGWLELSYMRHGAHVAVCFCVFLQILGSPQRLYDLAGPCVAEPETRKRSFSKRRSHLDLLKLLVTRLFLLHLNCFMSRIY